MKGTICVFGSFNVDITVHLPRFPHPGESLIAYRSFVGAGGKGANQAVAAARAGAKVHYIGKIGNDGFSEFARNTLRDSEIDTCTLFESEEKATGKALVYVSDDNAENMVAVDLGANVTFTEAEVNSCQSIVDSSDILLLQLETNPEAIVQLLRYAHEQEIFVILNPAPYQPVPDRYLAMADLITPNATEAALLTTTKVRCPASAQQAAADLHDRGVENVLITLGSSGALLSRSGKTTYIPVYPAAPKDTTGAGDAFNGAFAAALARKKSLPEATLFASAYASLCVENAGTASSMPYLAEVLERMEKHRAIHV